MKNYDGIENGVDELVPDEIDDIPTKDEDQKPDKPEGKAKKVWRRFKDGAKRVWNNPITRAVVDVGCLVGGLFIGKAIWDKNDDEDDEPAALPESNDAVVDISDYDEIESNDEDAV